MIMFFIGLVAGMVVTTLFFAWLTDVAPEFFNYPDQDIQWLEKLDDKTIRPIKRNRKKDSDHK